MTTRTTVADSCSRIAHSVRVIHSPFGLRDT
jgi:hypothetical protein